MTIKETLFTRSFLGDEPITKIRELKPGRTHQIDMILYDFEEGKSYDRAKVDMIAKDGDTVELTVVHSEHVPPSGPVCRVTTGQKLTYHREQIANIINRHEGTAASEGRKIILHLSWEAGPEN